MSHGKFKEKLDSALIEQVDVPGDPRAGLPKDIKRSLYGATLWPRISKVEQTDSAYYVEIGKVLRKEEFRVILRNKRIITIFPRLMPKEGGKSDAVLVIGFVKYLEDIEQSERRLEAKREATPEPN